MNEFETIVELFLNFAARSLTNKLDFVNSRHRDEQFGCKFVNWIQTLLALMFLLILRESGNVR